MNLKSFENLLPVKVVAALKKVRNAYLAAQNRRREESSAAFIQRKEFYGQFIKRGDVYFDIGANYGNRIGPIRKLGVSRILAVEPQKECCDHLRNKYKEIKVLQKGVGAENGKKDFFVSNISVLSSFSLCRSSIIAGSKALIETSARLKSCFPNLFSKSLRNTDDNSAL